MTANERMIIRDYLLRNGWGFIGAFVLHLIAMTVCWWIGTAIPLGILGGSAITLACELQRGGNATTRTMLSLPVTANQLARCWRFVALGFPAMLFLIPLVLGAGIGAAFDAPYLTPECLLLLAIAQTLCLGICYFALTGVPLQPGSDASIWQITRGILFGLLWAFPILVGAWFFMEPPRHFADLGLREIIAAIMLAAGTIAGWCRAEVLVRNLAERHRSGDRQIARPSPVLDAKHWQRCGGLSYLCLRFGAPTLIVWLAVLIIPPCLRGFTSGSSRGIMMDPWMIWMVVNFATLSSCTQLLGQLRLLRTLPLRTSTLTHWLVFWPLGLAMLLWLVVQGRSLLLDGTPVHWQSLCQAMFSASFLTIALPLTLRFGSKFWVLQASMVVPAILSYAAFSSLQDGCLKNHWGWALAGLAAIMLGVWRSTRRLLDTPHPWRAGAMKGLIACQRM